MKIFKRIIANDFCILSLVILGYSTLNSFLYIKLGESIVSEAHQDAEIKATRIDRLIQAKNIAPTCN